MTKLTRKLFVSIMTLVLTVMALGTSTFAWFSMNTTANADGMTVTAKSNATYLLIGQGTASGFADLATDAAKAAAIRTEADGRTGTAGSLTAIAASVASNVDAQDPDYTRYPSFFTTSAIHVADLNGSGTSDASDGLANGTKYTAVNANSWYTASNRNSNAAADAVVGVKSFDEDSDGTGNTLDFDDYVVEYVFYLTLTEDSENYLTGNHIQFTYTLASGGDAAISAVVKIEGSYYKLNSTSATATHTLGSDLTKDTALEVKVFIYVDGTSTNVNSDYINSNHTISGTAGVQFDLTF